MKVPGRAWLGFEVADHGQSSTIRQTAIFDPVGLSGLTYWYLLYPLHQFIFAGMLRNIARAAEMAAASRSDRTRLVPSHTSASGQAKNGSETVQSPSDVIC
jgi:hypothetical protein